MAIHKIRPDEPEGTKPTFMTACPTCDERTPHYVVDIGTDEHGDYQMMECAKPSCRTRVTVYKGEEGQDFQSNIDAPHDAD